MQALFRARSQRLRTGGRKQAASQKVARKTLGHDYFHFEDDQTKAQKDEVPTQDHTAKQAELVPRCDYKVTLSGLQSQEDIMSPGPIKTT